MERVWKKSVRIIRRIIGQYARMAASRPEIRFQISSTKEGEGKGTVVPVQNETPCHEGIWRSGDVQNSGTFSVSALDGGKWSALHTGRFTPRKGAPVSTA
jgi:hypothetical protein